MALNKQLFKQSGQMINNSNIKDMSGHLKRSLTGAMRLLEQTTCCQQQMLGKIKSTLVLMSPLLFEVMQIV